MMVRSIILGRAHDCTCTPWGDFTEKAAREHFRKLLSQCSKHHDLQEWVISTQPSISGKVREMPPAHGPPRPQNYDSSQAKMTLDGHLF